MATEPEAGSGRSRGGGGIDLAARGKRDMTPLLVKIGVAVAFSFSGFIISQLRSRHRAFASLPAPRRPSSSVGIETEASGRAGGGLKEELRILESEEALSKFVSGTTTTTTTTTTIVGLSPTRRSTSDEESFLLPEFNELVIKEFEDSGKDMEYYANMPTPIKSDTKEESLMEKELADLKELVSSLREREQSLEFQLLDYYGMQEQEAAMRELENQLKINSMEAKLYTLKIESLQAENWGLQAQLVDYSRAMNELEVARSKIKILKKKIRSDAEETRGKMIALNEKISILQSREQKDEAEIKIKLKRMKELDEEASKLGNENLSFAHENTALARQLVSTKHPSPSGGPEADALKEEAIRLREENQNLKKDIEQLQTDRCADVEELVYLRWVNACLRYELRNYEAPPGKTVARDLSKSLSPKSEEKAKQLILEYANSGADGKIINLIDFESECSSSQASTGESEDISGWAYSSAGTGNPKKMKFLKKLKKLILGNDIHSDKISAIDRMPSPNGGSPERRVSISSCSMDDMIGRYSYHSYSSCITDDAGPESDEQQHNRISKSSAYSRHSFGIPGRSRMNMEEDKDEGAELYENYDGTLHRHKRNVSEDARLINRILNQEETNTSERIELKKFADALTDSRRLSQRRSASFCN